MGSAEALERFERQTAWPMLILFSAGTPDFADDGSTIASQLEAPSAAALTASGDHALADWPAGRTWFRIPHRQHLAGDS